MNNIKCIVDFVSSKSDTKLLINQVSDTIGFFYVNLIETEAKSKSIKLNYEEDFVKETVNDLFVKEEIYLYFTTSKKIIEKCLYTNKKCVIFTDYKNFKVFINKVLTVNGYNYQKDIKYFLKDIHLIKDSEIIDYCTSSPHLTFSEISKYLINSSNYIKENKIKEKNNFILEIRKSLFDLKKSNKSPQEIYNNLKLEVRYKKFNFLIY